MDHSALPPEILTRIFELGIYHWDVRFLRPLVCVCRYWQEIIETTPRLWSIIVVRRNSLSLESLEFQLTKAKESPLSISVVRGVGSTPPLNIRLISLSYNWRYANLTTSIFALCRWANLCTNLKVLCLSRGRPVDDDPRDFFGGPNTQLEINLRSFTAIHLPKAWVLGLLGPSIRYFSFSRGCPTDAPHDTAQTFQYLSRINGAVEIELKNIRHSDVGLHTLGVAHFNSLRKLCVSCVFYTPVLLCSISAPSLQMLSIEGTYDYEHREATPMAPFFSQWSRSDFIPVNLHTLQLEKCLKVTDVPLLIHWLAYLPNIVRLSLYDEAIGEAATTLGQDANIYKALASPPSSALSGWLCPSLMILQVDTDEVVADLILVVRARGGIAPPDFGIPPPSRLRRIQAMLCSRVEPGERELLDFLVDNVNCFCCSMGD